MKCESCGFKNPESFTFCGQCGKPLLLEKKDDWRKYCVYCQFKDKSRFDGTSYCENCEGDPLEAPGSETGALDPSAKFPFINKGGVGNRFFSSQIYWSLIFFFLALTVFTAVVLGFRWLSFSQVPNEEEKEYLEFTDQCIDDYDVIVRKMGKIGNMVFRPEEAGFEERKVQALKEFESLNDQVEKVYRELKSRSCPARLSGFKKDLGNVYKIIYTRELPELKEFITVVDHSIVISMMSGDLNRSPFEKAVLVSEDVSRAMDKIIRLRYLKGVTEP